LKIPCVKGSHDMIAAFDVHYFKDDRARAAAVIFKGYTAIDIEAQYTAITHHTADYRPGEFYLRELPCILNLLNQFVYLPAQIIIDGYVMLGEHFGMGRHLFEALNGTIPIVGIAKNRFHNACGEAVFRGRSRNPLYVTAVGMDQKQAVEKIKSMHGQHRLPALLKRVDQLARGIIN
jgi:deoxyinosine 3'endonuclease (endonuclease V)